MADFISISKNDTQEIRKELELPVTKVLVYMKHVRGTVYEAIKVNDYVVVDRYQPSGTPSLEVTLETGEIVRILASYFAQMQKPSFVEDMANNK